eukprot:TRINITY_DN83488_c1_g1_i1.p1 TRINITY_DN83488_c1_g1~~TRINITY_DN83488_c1_g1_i1.p1  ORF type:complete len:373 (-),score=22.67 TRINITY_DN83488_c1_g1_i1:152-1270(-)
MDSLRELLPGQIPDVEDEENSTSTTSEDDFNLEEFRRTTRLPTQRASKSLDKGANFKSLEKGSNFKASFERSQQEPKMIKFLGIWFNYNYLLERNQNPILLLLWVFGLLIVSTTGFFVVFIVGQKFKLLPTIFGILTCIFSSASTIMVLQTSVKNGMKKNRNVVISVSLNVVSTTISMVYAFGWATPFDSVLLFFILLFCTLLAFILAGTTVINPFLKSPEDPNYQARFFFSRFLISFFDTTGMLDVLSDIKMGIELLRNFNGILKTLAIVLFILCAIDYSYLLLRMLSPLKSINKYIQTIIVEILVLGLTAWVFFEVKKLGDSERENSPITIVVLSLTTTGVNFFHHVFIVCDLLVSITGKKRGVDFSMMF